MKCELLCAYIRRLFKCAQEDVKGLHNETSTCNSATTRHSSAASNLRWYFLYYTHLLPTENRPTAQTDQHTKSQFFFQFVPQV